MGSFQFEWWTVEVHEATGKIAWEVKAKNKENAIKAINNRAKEYISFIQKKRPDFKLIIDWNTLKLDREGYDRTMK